MINQQQTSPRVRSSQLSAFRVHLLSYVSICLIQVLIWWNATPELFFWPVYSIAGWGVWVAFHAWLVRKEAE